MHTPRNNPAKFQKNPIDNVGGVVDKGPLYNYMYMKEMVSGGNFHQNEKKIID